MRLLPFKKRNQQFDAPIDNKQEHFPKSNEIGWRKNSIFFAFLIFKLNKRSISFTFLFKFKSKFSYRKTCLNYMKEIRVTKIYSGVRIKKV